MYLLLPCSSTLLRLVRNILVHINSLQKKNGFVFRFIDYIKAAATHVRLIFFIACLSGQICNFPSITNTFKKFSSECSMTLQLITGIIVGWTLGNSDNTKAIHNDRMMHIWSRSTLFVIKYQHKIWSVFRNKYYKD